MSEEQTYCTIDDVMKPGLRVAVVKSVQAVEGSEKLLRLEVEVGEETRQVLAGIAKSYAPEVLIGKQVVLVSNLAPRSMMGLESQGMLLCANGENGPVLLQPAESVPSGATIQ